MLGERVSSSLKVGSQKAESRAKDMTTRNTHKDLPRAIRRALLFPDMVEMAVLEETSSREESRSLRDMATARDSSELTT